MERHYHLIENLLKSAFQAEGIKGGRMSHGT